jgi:hypothetical protein
MHADPLRRGERFCAHLWANTPADPIAEIAHELAAVVRMNVPRAGSGAAYVEWSWCTGPTAARMAKMKSCRPVCSGMRMLNGYDEEDYY